MNYTQNLGYKIGGVVFCLINFYNIIENYDKLDYNNLTIIKRWDDEKER